MAGQKMTITAYDSDFADHSYNYAGSPFPSPKLKWYKTEHKETL